MERLSLRRYRLPSLDNMELRILCISDVFRNALGNVENTSKLFKLGDKGIDIMRKTGIYGVNWLSEQILTVPLGCFLEEFTESVPTTYMASCRAELPVDILIDRFDAIEPNTLGWALCRLNHISLSQTTKRLFNVEEPPTSPIFKFANWSSSYPYIEYSFFTLTEYHVNKFKNYESLFAKQALTQ